MISDQKKSNRKETNTNLLRILNFFFHVISAFYARERKTRIFLYRILLRILNFFSCDFHILRLGVSYLFFLLRAFFDISHATHPTQWKRNAYYIVVRVLARNFLLILVRIVNEWCAQFGPKFSSLINSSIYQPLILNVFFSSLINSSIFFFFYQPLIKFSNSRCIPNQKTVNVIWMYKRRIRKTRWICFLYSLLFSLFPHGFLRVFSYKSLSERYRFLNWEVVGGLKNSSIYKSIL